MLLQLSLHPVFSSEEKIRQAHKLEKLDEGVEALVDPKHAAMHNFGRGTPMAVILGSDGMISRESNAQGNKEISECFHSKQVKNESTKVKNNL